MAQIVINEISQNYTYNIGDNTFATVALPITASWGPCIGDPDVLGKTSEDILDEAYWSRFPANQQGLESFVATYRGPATISKTINDYSYQQAMTLLTAGYDVLVCRVCPGTKADNYFIAKNSGSTDPVAYLKITAKYPGSFGNNLGVTIVKDETWSVAKQVKIPYWSIVVYSIDEYGNSTPLENLIFTFNEDDVSDNLSFVSDVESKYIDIDADDIIAKIDVGTLTDGWVFTGNSDYHIPSNDDTSIAVRLGTSYNTGLSLEIQRGEDKGADQDVLSLLTKYGTDVDTKNTVIASVKHRYGGTSSSYYSTIDQLLGNVWVGTPTPEILPKSKNPQILPSIVTNVFITVVTDAPTMATGSVDPTDAGVGTNSFYYNTATSKYFEYVGSEWVEQDIGEGTYILEDTVSGESHSYTLYKLIVTSGTPSFATGIDISVSAYDGIWLWMTNNKVYSVTLANAAIDGNSTLTELGTIKTGDGAINPVFYNKEAYRQWIFTNAYDAYDILKDKLAYNPQRIISPGWDDQNILDYTDGELPADYIWVVSPLHSKIMDIAFYSRCAAGLLDVPKGLPKKLVCDDQNDAAYAQKLSTIQQLNLLYATHSALICPWGHYQYVGTGKQAIASPAFLFLLIQRAMLLNQAVQYEWALPDNRKQNLRIGKLDWNVGKHYLDEWSKLSGVSINCITNIPDMGVTIWGNSTLFNVPPATYNALQNLSTRYLVNALEDLAYRCGIGITFQYNNDQAYDKFYAGMTPLLDTMKNVGAIDDYYITMAADINGLDQVNANTVIGKVYIVVNGVINDIKIDLIALPPQTDLSQFGA